MSVDDYRIVNAYGETVFDSEVERENQARDRATREGEPFTATIDCPRCGVMAVHWLGHPRIEPERDDSPRGKAIRMINESIAAMAIHVGGPPRRQYDPLGTVVVRVCIKCGYRWGQS